MTWYGLYETTYTQQIKHLSESGGHLPPKRSLWQRFVEWVKKILQVAKCTHCGTS